MQFLFFLFSHLTPLHYLLPAVHPPLPLFPPPPQLISDSLSLLLTGLNHFSFPFFPSKPCNWPITQFLCFSQLSGGGIYISAVTLTGHETMSDSVLLVSLSQITWDFLFLACVLTATAENEKVFTSNMMSVFLTKL